MMKNKNIKINGTSGQKPRDLSEAVFHVLWPLNTWWKKIVFAVVILLAVGYFGWLALPEKIKMELIDDLKDRKETKSPASVGHGKGTSENIKNGDPNIPNKIRSEMPVKQKKDSFHKSSQDGIQQHTEGDQSPAVVSGGDVNINIGGKQK